MTVVSWIAVGLCALPLTVLGLRSLLAPDGIGEAMAVSPRGTPGMSTIRSVIGGLFLACVTMLGMGAATGETLWLLAVAIVMAAVAIGRIASLIADGFDKAVVPPLIIEIVIGATLTGAALG